jgi:Uncharacterized integral membrane protein
MTMNAPYPPPPSEPPPPRKSWRPTPRQVSGAILLVLAIVFIVENTGKVGVRIIIPKVHVPLFVALLIAALLGSLGTLLIQWRRSRRN